MSDTTCAICADRTPDPVICTSCTAKIRRDLDTVGRLRAQLDPTPGRTGSAGRASGKPGSRPPANLTIIAMADIRSKPIIDWETGRYGEDHVTPIDAELVDKARWIVQARQLSSPVRDAFDAIRVINISYEWVIRHPKVDEVAAVLQNCVAGLIRATHDTRDPIIGRCSAASPWEPTETCGGVLALTWDGPLPLDPTKQTAPTGVACRRCGDTWNIPDLVNIGRVTPLQVWETPPRIANMLGMSERTLRHWIMTKKIHRNSLGMVCHAEVWRILKEQSGPQPQQTTGGPSPT